MYSIDDDSSRTTIVETDQDEVLHRYAFLTGDNDNDGILREDSEEEFGGEREATRALSTFREPTDIPNVTEVHRCVDVDLFDIRSYLCSYRNALDADEEQRVVKILKQDIPLGDIEELEELEQFEHPNLRKLYDVFQQGGLVLQYCAGEALETVLDDPDLRGRIESMTYRVRARAARDLTSAVVYLHEREVAHCDLRSSNVFFSADIEDLELPRLIVGDLCTSRCFSANLMRYYSHVVRYMAPEMILCGLYSLSADVFSSGILVYEIMSCRLPYRGHRGSSPEELGQAICEGERPDLDAFREAADGALVADFLPGCWGIPGDRISAETLLAQVERVIQN